MYGLTKKVVNELQRLKENHHIEGLKAEFEAEGASFRDLVRLRYLTALAGVNLYVKIGGVEALRDIKDCFELGVDGLIAPMVESKFGIKKFTDSVKKIFKNENIYLSINLETRNAVEEMDEIIEYSKGRINNITIGRTDLSASFFDENITPDSWVINNVITKVGEKINQTGITLTIGGGLGISSIETFRAKPHLHKYIHRLETRKVILPKIEALKGPEAIRDSLKFEELHILLKKEVSDLMIETDIHRLTELIRRF